VCPLPYCTLPFCTHVAQPAANNDGIYSWLTYGRGKNNGGVKSARKWRDGGGSNMA